VAGTNKVLNEGQVLFKTGDKSDGMYLIRKGELRVYLEQDGKEVTLATIGEGGMIGEMALFDNMPRSASVKATKATEVTLISLEDFGKLMKQIPKWFVGLMSALSGRLRTTNDRLKKLESGAAGAPPGAAKSGKPFMHVIRQLNIFVLLWHKDGEKDGKEWVLQKAATEKAMVELFNEDPEKIKRLFETLVKAKVLATKQDSYKNLVFATANRGLLSQLASFVAAFSAANPAKPYLSDDCLAMLKLLERLVNASPYDTLTASLADLEKEGKRDGVNTTAWAKEIEAFAKAGEEVKLTKTSTGPGLRSTKKDVGTALRNHEAIAALYKANLA
jgi:CRP-like cAMP-binding protein